MRRPWISIFLILRFEEYRFFTNERRIFQFQKVVYISDFCIRSGTGSDRYTLLFIVSHNSSNTFLGIHNTDNFPPLRIDSSRIQLMSHRIDDPISK
jgi:hypothetical protein